MNVTNISHETLNPPTKLWSDYVQIGYFLLMVILGVPLNLYSLSRTIPDPCQGFMRLLKIHLAITDLMILCFFALSKLIWWSTYEWLAGDFLCKLVQFLNSFAYCSCSNLVASVAIVRWMVVRRVTTSKSFEYHKFLLLICLAYILAFVCSLPQFFVWGVIHPYPRHPQWTQCVTKSTVEIWLVTDDEQLINEKLYHLFHLVIVFWIPFTVVTVCYLRVFFLLKRNIREIDTTLYNFKALKNNNIDKDTSDYVDLSKRENTVSSFIGDYSQIETVPLKKLSQKSLSSCTLIKAKNSMVKKTAYILLAYGFCWSSYNILALLQHMGLVYDNSYWRYLYNLIVLNAVLNPFIYGI